MSDIMLMGALREPVPALCDLGPVKYMHIVGVMAKAADEIESLRAQLSEARNAALEEAAQLVDEARRIYWGRTMSERGLKVADEIRALKSQEKT